MTVRHEPDSDSGKQHDAGNAPVWLPDHPDLLIWQATTDGRTLLHLNHGAEASYGQRVRGLSSDRDWWQEVVDRRDHDAFADSLRRSRFERVDHEYRIVLANGRKRRLRERLAQVSRPQDKDCILVGVATDITTQKDVEQELTHARARYQSLVESLPLNLLLKDRNGIRTFANQRYLDLHRLTLGEVIGKSDYDLFPNELADRYAADDRKVIEDGAILHDVEEIQTRDGERRWIERVKAPIRDVNGTITGLQVLFWDVTDREHAEQQLKFERFLMQSLLANIPDAIYFKDTESRFLRISQSMAEKFRLQHPDDAVGKTDADIFTSEHAAQAREDELRIMQSGEPLVARVEKETWPDREDTWCSSTKMPLRDENSAIVGTFGISRDVTGIIQAETALERERDLLRTLINHLPDLVFVKDREGRFVVVNEAVAEYMRVGSVDDVIGKTDFDLAPAKLAAKFREDDERVMSTGQALVAREECVRDEDGNRLWLLTTKVPLRSHDGDVIGLVGIGRDISGLKQAQEQSARQALEANLLHRATTTAAETDSLSEVLQRCVDIVCTLTGWDIGHAYLPESGDGGTRLVSSGIWHVEGDQDLDEFRQLTETTEFRSGEGFPGRIWKSGSPLWVQNVEQSQICTRFADLTESPVQGAFGLPIKIRDELVAVLEFFATHELDEDKRLLAVFQSLGEQVGRVIERKRSAEALRVARDAADAANRAKSDFLANMSHEIRTPMNAVIGMAELLKDTNLDRSQYEFVKMIHDSGEALLSLINDILDFSKIESGKLAIECVPFQPADVVGDSVRSLAVRAHAKELELALHVSPAVPRTLVGDPIRLRQIILNLVGNAIKFTESGEIVVEARVVDSSTDTITIRFSVEDTGIGIPAEKQQQIFSAFEQADSSMTRRFGGTGLGLTITSRLIELMGGRLEVESEPGVGSRFTFELEFERYTEPVVEQEPVVPADLTGVKALVVDDNSTNRRILAEMLETHEMDCLCVESAEKAIAELRQASASENPFQLMLTDINMPETDGFQLIEKVRSDSKLEQPTILALTSGDRPGDAERCERLQVAHHLLKPIKRSELIQCMATALSAASGANSTDKSSGEAHEAETGPLRILLAEDAYANQVLAIGLLKKWGHETIVAQNGLEALQLLESESFDVVLMDVQMPEMDGIEATRTIRSQEASAENLPAHRPPRMPIIAMTAHAMKGDRENCLAAGMDGYVSKPIRPAQLQNVIAEVMQKSWNASDSRASSHDRD